MELGKVLLVMFGSQVVVFVRRIRSFAGINKLKDIQISSAPVTMISVSLGF
jgi:hypothetical protein